MQRIYVLFLALILLLTACGDSATPTPTPEPVETIIEPALDLEQTFEGSMANGAEVSISYPTDWGVQADVPDFGIAFTFPEDLTATMSSETEVIFEADQIQVIVLFSPKANFDEVLENPTATGLMESFLENVDSSTGGVGEVVSTTIDGRDAATVLLSEASGDSYAIVIDAGDALVTLTGTFASGSLNQYQATIEAMAASATYSAMEEATPEVTEEMTAEATESAD